LNESEFFLLEIEEKDVEKDVEASTQTSSLLEIQATIVES